MAKPKTKQEEALQFLDDLDSFEPPLGTPGAGQAAPPAGEEEVYAFIDEITQKSSEPPRITTTHVERPLSRAGTPTVRKSTERVKVGQSTPLLPSPSGTPSPHTKPEPTRVTLSAPRAPESVPAAGTSGGGWGWGSVWSSATAAVQQARNIVDEQVKNLPKNEQARKWGEGVLEYAKAAQLDKIGQDFKRVGLSTLTDLLNVVAPPISEHEVIQVWLGHDMKGYDGIESLVYRALARILEQVEGGDLIVNRGNESRPKDAPEEVRDLNVVEGLEAAIKLAQANIEEMTKRNVQPPPTESALQNPTTHSYVYIWIQPYSTTINVPQTDGSDAAPIPHNSAHFLIYLSDPAHKVLHTTISQAVPFKWLDLWDEYDWVEDLAVEAIRVSVEVIGQEYIVSRMGWDKKKEIEAVAEESVPATTEAS
ncbi:hypothetical protein NLI96_g7230 [Meripilus lineatus]|uniref:Maintenance of telomere capping protein 1 n=1 Tax=Meripilus lineatus TaxID=2056292 RepID=A0AAD5V1T7_9APHY|nr:hypothetical protein NLI96_g7230 [Physisporinus lineatus]